MDIIKKDSVLSLIPVIVTTQSDSEVSEIAALEHGFYRTVKELLEKEPEKEFTLLCCNIENLRLYNDTFGRKAGDKLLKEAVEIFRKRVSEKSVCCRYTADRFLCLTDKESELKGRESFSHARKTTRSELSDNLSVKIGIYEIIDRTIPVELMCDRAVWVVDTTFSRVSPASSAQSAKRWVTYSFQQRVTIPC